MTDENRDIADITVSIVSVNGHRLEPLEPEHLTDLGNAQRLVRTFGKDIRFVHAWNTWLCWDGKRWLRDSTGQIYRYAKDVIRGLYAEAAYKYADDEKARRDLLKHAM